jgi:hypothetical protein
MFLREIFEAEESTVAIIFGRFNPPHKGHKAAWELASQSPKWYVGTNKSTVGPKDPLPFDIKVEAMKTIWPEVENHIVAETSWLTLASKVFEENPDATLLCLTDEDWVTKTIEQYNGKEGSHGFYNFKNIKQKPTPRLSSATALRDAVTKGNRDAFTQAAGVDADTEVAGTPFFDLVAEYLLPYSNAPKKAAKKKEPAVAEGDSDWSGSQGNFAGDKPVNLGGTVSKRLDVDDVVTYFGEKATILAMSKDRTISRINLKSGITQNVKTSDLKRVGQKNQTGAKSDPFTVNGKTMPQSLRTALLKMSDEDGQQAYAAWRILVGNSETQDKMNAGDLLNRLTKKYSVKE